MVWTIDSTHSYVSFAIRVLGVSTTKGRFNALRGQLSLDEQNPASSWVEAEVDAASIDTHIRLRDAHLRSAAFFAVKQYPTIVFKSTKVEHVGGQDYKVMGNLTLLGVTKPVTFDVTYRGQRPIPVASTSLTARATINRHDFGLGQGMRLQFAAGEVATVEISLEAVQQPVEKGILRCELCEQYGDELDVQQKVIQPDMLIGTMHARTVVSYPCTIDDRQAVAQAKFLHRT